MKKFLSFFAMAAIALTFAACSDDEEGQTPNEPVTTMTDVVAGTYSTSINVNLNGTDLPEANYDVVIEKANDTEINFVLNDFSISLGTGEALNLGDIRLDEVAISQSGSNYTFATTDTLTLAIFPGMDAVPVPIDFVGSFTSSTIDATIDINLSGMQILVEITGSKNGSTGGEEVEPTPGGEEEPEVALSAIAAGDYACNIAVELNGTPFPASENAVTIEAVNDSTVNFVLKDFSISLGESSLTPTNENGEAKITLTDVVLTESDGGIVFTKEQTPNLVIAEGSPAIPVPIVANGTFADNSLNAHFDINIGEAMVIAVTIEGQK